MRFLTRHFSSPAVKKKEPNHTHITMGIRHSKKSVDIQSSPKKNGSTETEVKVKELTEDAPVKAEDAKSGETIEEVAEKTAAPNGDATAEQTQVEVSTSLVQGVRGVGGVGLRVGSEL